MADGDGIPLRLEPAEQERLRRAEVAAYAALYDAAAPLGVGHALIDGAVAVWNPHDDDLGFNYLLGFEGVPDPDRAWARAEAAARAGGARVFAVGVTPERLAWATPSKLAALSLVADHDEVVWAARLTEAAAGPPAAGMEIRGGALDPDLFARVLNRGWELPDGHARGRLYAATLGRPGWSHYLALVDGRPAGAAVLAGQERVAVCMVAATDPAARGRGVQTALIGRRLADARAAGCDLAITETVADNASPRNFRRAGFRLLHRRRIYGKALD